MTTYPRAVSFKPKSDIPLTQARAAVLAAAISQLGVPYSYGGGDITGPSLGILQGSKIVGYDCARFTRYAYFQGTKNAQFKPRKFLNYGTGSPTSNDGQWAEGILKGSTWNDIATNANIGDLIFFNGFGHVGILSSFAATDQWGHVAPQVIHAPHTGDVVKYENVYAGEPFLSVCGIRQYLPTVEQPPVPNIV